MGSSILGELPHNAAAHFQAERQRISRQYAAIFEQRLEGALNDFNIGFIGGRNVAIDPTDSPKAPDIVTIKPAVFGVSIDLREAWRRATQWWSARRKKQA